MIAPIFRDGQRTPTQPYTARLMTVSAAFVLLMPSLILFKTSQIVRRQNQLHHVAASLLVSIYNLFLRLLQLIGFAMTFSSR